MNNEEKMMRQDSIAKFLDQTCGELNQMHPERFRAIIKQDGQILSTGLAKIEKTEGVYWPSERGSLDNFPRPEKTLRVTDTEREFDLTRFRACPAKSEHFHFDIASALS